MPSVSRRLPYAAGHGRLRPSCLGPSLEQPLNCATEKFTLLEQVTAYPLLSTTNLTGYCKKEMACWRSGTPTSACSNASSNVVTPSTCTRLKEDEIGIAPPKIDWINWVAAGCVYDTREGLSILDAIAGPDGSTCGTESVEYYMDIPMSSVRATVAIMFGVVVPILWSFPPLPPRSALSSRRAAPPIASSTATRAASSADALISLPPRRARHASYACASAVDRAARLDDACSVYDCGAPLYKRKPHALLGQGLLPGHDVMGVRFDGTHAAAD